MAMLSAGSSYLKRPVTGVPMETNQSAETSFEAEGSKMKRKRRRIAKSCLNCRQRKVKCDRVVPCMQCCLRGQQDTCTVAPNVPDAESTSAQVGISGSARAATITSAAAAPSSWHPARQRDREETTLLDAGESPLRTYKAEREDTAEVRWAKETQDSSDDVSSLFHFSNSKASNTSPSPSMSSMPPPPRRRATVHGGGGVLESASNEMMWTASVDIKLDRLEAQLDRLLESVESLEQNLVKPYTQQYWPSTISSSPSSIPYAFPAPTIEASFTPALRNPSTHSLHSTLTSTTSPVDTPHFTYSTSPIASSSSASTSMPSLSADSSTLVSPMSANLHQSSHQHHHLLQQQHQQMLLSQQEQAKYAPIIPVNAPFPNTSSSTIAAPVSNTLYAPSPTSTLTSTTDNNWTDLLAPPVVPNFQSWTSVTTG